MELVFKMSLSYWRLLLKCIHLTNSVVQQEERHFKNKTENCVKSQFMTKYYSANHLSVRSSASGNASVESH